MSAAEVHERLEAYAISMAEFRRLMKVGLKAAITVRSSLELAELAVNPGEVENVVRVVLTQTPHRMTVQDVSRNRESELRYERGSKAWQLNGRIIIRCGPEGVYATYLTYHIL